MTKLAKITSYLGKGLQGLQNATGFKVECKLKFRDLLTFWGYNWTVRQPNMQQLPLKGL